MKKIIVLSFLFLVSCLRIQDPPDDTTTYTHPTNNREWTLKKKWKPWDIKMLCL